MKILPYLTFESGWARHLRRGLPHADTGTPAGERGTEKPRFEPQDTNPNTMKTKLLATLGLCSLALPLQGEILEFDLSPSGTSAAVGLSPANEVPPATGTGSGGEVFSGILYNTDTNVLSVALGYGSFAGFTDLTGVATAAHIHGPAATTATAPPIHDFVTAGQHIAAPTPTTGGLIIGNVTLSAANETSLMAGQLYVNIHTAANANGEIRGQLIESTNAEPTVVCPLAGAVECTSHDDTEVELTATVADTDGDELTVVWTIDGTAQPEIVIPAAASGGTSVEVPFTATLGLGEHTVSVAVTDGNSVAVSCETTVTVEDTVAPEITSVEASPATLWPPNGKMKTVNVSVEAEDACGEVTSKITSVSSSDGGAADYVIVDDDTVKLRARRAGNTVRTYTITVEASDESGNTSTDTVEVIVPKSQGHGGR